MPSFKYPQTHHMKAPAEFERCYARKRSASDGLLVVYACENELAHPRLGCSVSKKVGNAVVRNRYKRLFREAFRLAQHDLPSGVDLILIPRPGPYPALEPLKASLVTLARQAVRKLGEGKRSLPAPLAGEGGGAAPSSFARPLSPSELGERTSERGEGALGVAHPRSSSEAIRIPLTRLEDSPPSPVRGEGKGPRSEAPQ